MNSQCSPVDIDNLVDIRSVNIDPSRPVTEKRKAYYRQLKNPVRYRYDDIKVSVSHTETEITFEDRIKQLMLSGQGMDLISN